MRSLSEVHAVAPWHDFLSSSVYSSAVAPSGPDTRYRAEITGPHKMNIALCILLLLLFWKHNKTWGLSSKQDAQCECVTSFTTFQGATASRTYQVRRRVSAQMKRCCYNTAKTGCFIFLAWLVKKRNSLQNLSREVMWGISAGECTPLLWDQSSVALCLHPPILLFSLTCLLNAPVPAPPKCYTFVACLHGTHVSFVRFSKMRT